MESKKMVKMLCGAEAEDVQGEALEEIKKYQVYADDGIILPIPGKPEIPKKYLAQEHYLYNFKFRPTDIFICGPMKSGTTWLHEILWNVFYNADLDNPEAARSLMLRLPWFEVVSFFDLSDPKILVVAEQVSALFNQKCTGNIMDSYETLPNPRIFKTHLLPYLLNPKIFEICKLVYITRNPIDSFQSFYHFVKKMDHHKFSGTLEEFTSTYIEGKVFMGNAALNMKQWWPYRDHEKLHYVLYEDLKKSPASTINKMGKFLGVNLGESQLENIVTSTGFKKMKEKDMIPTTLLSDLPGNLQTLEEIKKNFFREGKAGTAKDNLPKEIYDRLAAYFREELKDLDLPYEF